MCLLPTLADGVKPELFIFNELCALKDDQGPCKAIKDRFFFNVDTGHCEQFEYGGCGGNANNFKTLEQCEEMCVVSGESNSFADTLGYINTFDIWWNDHVSCHKVYQCHWYNVTKGLFFIITVHRTKMYCNFALLCCQEMISFVFKDCFILDFIATLGIKFY